MKKIFLIGAAALGMFFMTTSCMDNTEPAGIEAMRQAKAELITAQAAYQNALAATEQANAAIKQAEAEYATLVNQIKEIEVQEAQLDLELAQAENEYKIAQLEYEYQKQMVIDSAEIMRLKSLIAGYEWEILRNEMEMEKLEYQRKEALEMHNAYMYDLQKLTAEAQQRYERALAEIEAASYGLTDAQKNKLNDMVLKMQYYRKWLNDAEDKLIAAQNDLLDAQYALGRDTVYYKELYQIEKEAQAQKVTDLQELLAEAQAMDFSDLDALTAEKEALEAANQQIDKDIAELRNQAAEKAAAERAPLKAQKTEIDAQKAEINHSIRDLYLQVGYKWDDQSHQYVSTGGVSGALNERHDFEVEIPEAIVPHVATIFNEDKYFGTNEGSHDPTTSPNPSEPSTDDVVILSGFEQVDGEWTLPGGVYSWRTTYAKTKEILNGNSSATPPVDGLLDKVADLAIDPASLSNVELVLGEQQEKLTELTAEYEYFLGVFNEGLAAFNTAAAAYGITYHSSNDFVADKENLMAAATEAYNAYKDANPPTEAQTKAFVDAVYAEQSARADLVGNSYDWEDLTYANLTAASPTITIDEVIAAYDNSVKNPVIVILNGKKYDYTGTPLTMDTKLDDYNAAAKWDLASQKLYDLNYLRAAVTEELIGYGEIFEIEVEDVTALTALTTKITSQDTEAALKERLIAIGYDETDAVNLFKDTDFYKYLAQGVIVETLSSMVSNNALYVALNEDLKAINEDIKTIEKEQNDGQTEIFLQIRDLYAQLEDLQEQASEIDVQIAAKELEISAIAAYEKADTDTDYKDETYSQAKILKDQKEANNVAIGVIDEAIGALKYEIDGKELSPDAQKNVPPKFTFDGVDYDTIEELYDAWVKNIKEDVALAQYELAECEEKLERMLNSKGNPMEQAVADAERKLEQAQQDYDIALQQFNYWNEALNQMMAALIGNTEENPEA